MKTKLITGGIYNMGFATEKNYCIVLSQNEYTVRVYQLTTHLSERVNNREDIVSTLGCAIFDYMINPFNFLKFEESLINQDGFISGYLGNIPDEMLDELLNTK